MYKEWPLRRYRVTKSKCHDLQYTVTPKCSCNSCQTETKTKLVKAQTRDLAHNNFGHESPITSGLCVFFYGKICDEFGYVLVICINYDPPFRWYGLDSRCPFSSQDPVARGPMFHTRASLLWHSQCSFMCLLPGIMPLATRRIEGQLNAVGQPQNTQSNTLKQRQNVVHLIYTARKSTYNSV